MKTTAYYVTLQRKCPWKSLNLVSGDRPFKNNVEGPSKVFTGESTATFGSEQSDPLKGSVYG